MRAQLREHPADVEHGPLTADPACPQVAFQEAANFAGLIPNVALFNAVEIHHAFGAPV